MHLIQSISWTRLYHYTLGGSLTPVKTTWLKLEVCYGCYVVVVKRNCSVTFCQTDLNTLKYKLNRFGKLNLQPKCGTFACYTSTRQADVNL